jgi:hypothetical protein
MKICKTGFRILCCLLFLGIPETGLTQPKTLLTETEARQEALLAITHIKLSHPNPYRINDESVWEAYENKLLSREGPVSIGEQYFDLAYLFSLAVDTHTQIYPDVDTPGFYQVYPLRFRSFSDGLYVFAANEDYEEYVGKKVLEIGSMPVDVLMEKLSHYVSADHEGRKKTLAEFLLVIPEMYSYLGLMDSTGVSLVLEGQGGRRVIGRLQKVENKSFGHIFYKEPDSFGILVPEGWKTVFDIYSITPPLSRQHLRKKYWHTSITDSKGKRVEYIQINKNENEPEGETQFDFILRTFQAIRKEDVRPDRIILDLRYNLGGWIKNTAALPGLLYGADFYQAGKTIVLIGRETVSAGAILAASIEMKNYVCFLGEPSGSKPNMFLDHKPVELPYSRFYAESATDTYTATVAADNREFIAPDFFIEESFEDFISGEDKVLQKAIGITENDIINKHAGLFRGELWKRPSQMISLPSGE